MGDAGARLGDAVATHENFAGSDEGGVLNVEQVSGVQHGYLWRGLGAERYGECEDECG
jgi:hypothetical protein